MNTEWYGFEKYGREMGVSNSICVCVKKVIVMWVLKDDWKFMRQQWDESGCAKWEMEGFPR